MDVFNGLEDVRQYFQGLPAATGATASPGYQHQTNNGGPSDPGHDRSSSSSNVPYWPPQHELQARPPTRESTPQRPASHHSDSSSSRPPSHHNIQHASDPKTRTTNNIQVASSAGYAYVNHEPQPGAPQHQQQQSFQFSVPHSRESNASSQQQQRIPSRSSDLTSPQSYHQLQPPQNQTAQQQQPSNQNYSYENHSSYYNNKSGTAPINTYKGAIALQQSQQQASSQQRVPPRTSDLTNPQQSYHQQSQQQTAQNSYNYENHMYYNPPISSSNNSNNKTAASPINSYAYKTYPPQGQSHAALEAKEHALNNHNTQQQQQQQQHKSTHNLPPIAALSNYHTGRSSREALRIPTSRPNKIATTTTTTSTNKQYNVTQPATQPQSRVTHPNHPADNLPSYRNVSQYSNYHHSSPSYYSVTSATTSTNNTNSYSTPSYPQPTSAMQHQVVRSNNMPPKTVNQQQYLQNSSAVDSVLDLSLKTIKTPADSTLDDSEENQRNNKYYQRQQLQNQQHQLASQHNQVRYPENYANNQRNLHASGRQGVQQLSTGAPKVDFLPNFNMPMTQNYKPERRQVLNTYDKAYQQQSQNQQTQRHHQSQQAVNMQQQYNSQQVLQNNSYVPSKKTPMEGLPRIDFPPTNQMQKGGGLYQSSQDRKRSATQQLSSVVQNKKPRMDDRWRQVIDKQIEQKFSSYQSSKPATAPQAKDLVVNGNFLSSNEKNTYQSSQYQMQTHHQYTPSANSQYHQMNQTYVPSAAAHHYPSHITHGQQQQMHPQQQTQQQPQQHPLYQQNLTRSNSHTSLNSSNNSRSQQQGADKRIISILRSNLEMKGANKEAQKKMEQTQFKTATYDFNQRPREVQHPSTDVTAPLQPKHGFIGRQNVSPFTAASLIERSTPPTYKFPKAIDSVRFEEEKPDHSSLTNQADLDGLAANLAARIRTKGELKQVSQHANYIRHTSPGLSLNDIPLNGSTNNSNSSPPKEKASYAPRRRLFSRNEEDQGEQKSIAPPRDKTGMRSSSETSVFDFPDSGDESEVPMFERQSLEDMRRDRKSISKQSLVNENDFKDEKISRMESPIDDFFNQACDNFLEQLMKGGGKKRGRRKKMEPDVLAKLETVTKEKPLNSENPDESPPVVKIEETITKEEAEDDPKPVVNNNQEQEVTKIEEESDSDVPLSKCKKDVVSAPVELARSTPIKEEEITGAPIAKIEFPSEPASDSEEEISKCSDAKFRARKLKEQIRKSKELNNIRDITSKLLKKPAFGDGSDFYPGWEEELYNYKKSLRIPRNLIQVTRPPNCNRLSTSLPDLDPCPSPTPSSVTDASEYCKFKTKTKSENFDSDMDSNSSFNFSLSKSFDSDEGGSVKSMNVPNKIMDRLLERYGGKKRKRLKKKEEQQGGPKLIPKSDNILELLPTPSLEIKEEQQTKKSRATIIKSDSVFFGFRKKTVESFKDTFIKNSKSLVGVSEQFTTVVLKSRTRTETRVLKQKATMREVFGEDRPASAPPVTCVDELKDQKAEIKKEPEDTTSSDKNNEVQTTKEVLKNKLLKKKSTTQEDAGKTATSQSDGEEEAKKEGERIEAPKVEPEIKSETPSLDGEENVANKKKNKFRNIRRKGSSGFDYIRKKKKQVKKETSESSEVAKNKRRAGLPKTNLESVQDIQKEIKMWVLNKGIGETHLHRSARLGYTDITAYCLEKMQCSPSPKDNAGYTPLHEACSRGHLEIAKLLLMYGANASESAQGGIRPLHEAAENGYVEIVRLLLSYGADPNLATYSGSTPLSLTTEESTITLLKNHINDIQGIFSKPWSFAGPASCFDPEETGYDPLDSPPTPDPPSEDEDMDFEVSEVILPNLYTLTGEPPTDRWVLLQDLSNLLKIKSKDALLRQINPPTPGTSSSTASGHKAILRELKMADFLEQARCCQFLNAGEKINGRSSKVALVKYTDKVRQLLNVEKVLITAR